MSRSRVIQDVNRHVNIAGLYISDEKCKLKVSPAIRVRIDLGPPR
jgi:hypothetical protein